MAQTAERTWAAHLIDLERSGAVPCSTSRVYDLTDPPTVAMILAKIAELHPHTLLARNLDVLTADFTKVEGE